MGLVYKLFWQGYLSRKQKLLLRCWYNILIYVLCITNEWFELNRINTICPKGEYDDLEWEFLWSFLSIAVEHRASDGHAGEWPQWWLHKTLGGFGFVYSHLKRLTLRLLIHIGSSFSNEWSEASCSSTQALRTVSLFREVQVYSDLVWGCLWQAGV